MTQKDRKDRINRRLSGEDEYLKSLLGDDAGETDEDNSSSELQEKLVEFEKELKKVNGTSFIWQGQAEQSNRSSAVKKGFIFAGEKDFIEEYQDFNVLGLFYISDVSVLEPKGDSRSLVAKYTDQRRFVQPGVEYFLNLNKD